MGENYITDSPRIICARIDTEEGSDKEFWNLENYGDTKVGDYGKAAGKMDIKKCIEPEIVFK